MAQKRSTTRSEVADDEAVVPLQAVLLADSFTQRFRPITTERPKVLLPLVNVPMIDYALEWLASAGVEEVFVFCCAHAKQVTSYLEHSNRSSQPNFTVTPIESRDCISAGDALRVIEQRNVIRGDFVLLSGDTVSNMPLKEVLKEHQERRKKDKWAVMTMVIRRTKSIPYIHQTRLGNEELFVVIDPTTKQLLHYDTVKEASGTGTTRQQSLSRLAILEKSLLDNRPSVELRADVQDCHVDICSPEVLLLFTDNFDYQNLRRDFVKGLLSDEIMGNKIFTYEISAHYAARIDSFRAYDVVSKDIIHRWTYPMVPDIRFATPGTGIKIGRCDVYKEDGVTSPQTAIIGPSTVIGTGTCIGDNTVIQNSVIGRSCKIGNNVRIEGSHVWNNVTVGDNVTIQSSIVCDGVILKAGCSIEPGVVLSFKVIIGENFKVPPYSQISLTRQSIDEDSSDEELEYAGADQGEDAESFTSGVNAKGGVAGSDDRVDDAEPPQWEPAEVGVGGAGCKWSSAQDDEWRHSVAPIPKEKIEEMMALEEEGEQEDVSQDLISITNGGALELELDEDEDEEEEDDDAFFEKEVEALFRRAVTGESTQDHVVLEVNALKLAYNRSFSDCAGAMFKSFLNLALEAPHTTARFSNAWQTFVFSMFSKTIQKRIKYAIENEAELLQSTAKVVKEWGPLLQRYLKHQDDEVEVLLRFEEVCLDEVQEYAPVFSLVLRDLYFQDIISEDAVFAWASEKQGGDDTDKVFVTQCADFIQWLQVAEEE